MGMEYLGTCNGISRILTVILGIACTIIPHYHWPYNTMIMSLLPNSQLSHHDYFWIVSMVGVILSAIIIILMIIDIWEESEKMTKLDGIFHVIWAILLLIAVILLSVEMVRLPDGYWKETKKDVERKVFMCLEGIFQILNTILYFFIGVQILV